MNQSRAARSLIEALHVGGEAAPGKEREPLGLSRLLRGGDGEVGWREVASNSTSALMAFS